MSNNPTKLARAWLLCVLYGVFMGCGARVPPPSARTQPVYPIKKGGLWGAIDKQGNILVEPSYDNASYGYCHDFFDHVNDATGQE
ncbi:MAG: WG repeat-containing protein, partial [Planctomycetales bacterium]|nr:WG repeat-containing protein [Planctomycetales bacterium]